MGGVACAPQAIFFWVEKSFLYTRIPPFKNGYREALKKYIHLFFRPRELKIVQKKGDFTVSAHFGPVLGGQNASNRPKINFLRL